MLVVICMILTLRHIVHAGKPTISIHHCGRSIDNITRGYLRVDFAFGGFGAANEPIVGLKLVGNATYQRCNGAMPSIADGTAVQSWSINGTVANIEAIIAPGICATGVDCRYAYKSIPDDTNPIL